MNKSKLIEIRIEAAFGSQFQEDFAIKSLDLMLKAWRAHLTTSHKRTAIDFSVWLEGQALQDVLHQH
jgi:hypothetical protein